MATQIYTLLSSEHSKEISSQIVDIIVRDKSRMSELMVCFFDDEMRICQRASWPMTMISEQFPNLIKPYINDMVHNLEDAAHDAVIRNTFRSFQFLDFDEEIEGLIFEKGYEYLLDINVPVGIRVFAMTTCANIAMKYPELSAELIPIIEEHLPHGKPAYKFRGKKELTRLRKLKL